MSRYTAFFDANVIFPPPLRSFLMHLLLKDLFQAKWSAMVHEEWIRAVLRKKPEMPREKLEETRRLMDAHAGDCLVTNFESLIDGLDLPDKGDRHILAAAIKSGAQVIVTRNLNDFPAQKLAAYNIEAQHPDDFIMHLIDVNEGHVVTAAKNHRAEYTKPPIETQEYLNMLERQGLM